MINFIAVDLQLYKIFNITSVSFFGIRIFLSLTKEEVHVFARVCLFVCLLARLLKNACMDLDEILHVDRCRDVHELINF